MRQIKKLSQPKILATKNESWTCDLLGELGKSVNFNDLPKDRRAHFRSLYRKKAIKEQLRREAKGKCGYCETEISTSQPGDIDHIKPTSKFAQLTYTWRNLLFSCKICNQAKSDYFVSRAPLVNPFVDNPIKHLGLNHDGTIQPFTQKGLRTRKEAVLDRTALIERRSESLAAIIILVELHNLETRKSVRAGLKRAIFLQLTEKASYSTLLKQWVSQTLR